MRRESEAFTESKDPECASSGIAAARRFHSALLKAQRERLASSVVRPASSGSFDCVAVALRLQLRSG
jgi:hypothetical protein